MINLLVELLHSVLIHEIIRNNWCLIYDISSPEIRRSDQSWPRHKILHCPYCEHVCRWALSYLLIISNSGCYLLIITCGRQDVIMSHWWIANYSTEKYQCWLSVPSPLTMPTCLPRCFFNISPHSSLTGESWALVRSCSPNIWWFSTKYSPVVVMVVVGYHPTFDHHHHFETMVGIRHYCTSLSESCRHTLLHRR